MGQNTGNEIYKKELETIYQKEFAARKPTGLQKLSEDEMLDMALKLYVKVNALNQRYNKLGNANYPDKWNIYYTICRIIESGYPVWGNAKDIELEKDRLSYKLEDMIATRSFNNIVLIEPHHDDALGSASSMLFDPHNYVTVYTMSKSDDIRDQVDLSKPPYRRKIKIPTNMHNSVKKHIRKKLDDYHYDYCYEKENGRCDDYGTLVQYYIEHDPSAGKIEQTAKEIIYEIKTPTEFEQTHYSPEQPYILVPLALQHPMHILTTYYCVKYAINAGMKDKVIFYIDHPYDYFHQGSEMDISPERRESTKQYYENMLGNSYVRADAAGVNQADAAHLLRALYGEMHYGEFAGSLENTMCSYLVPLPSPQRLYSQLHLKCHISDSCQQDLCSQFHLNNHNILYAAFQAKPFSKSGGLGEVAFTYVKSMQPNVDRIAIITPKYKTLMNGLPVITRKNNLCYSVHYDENDGTPLLGEPVEFSDQAIELMDMDGCRSYDFSIGHFKSSRKCRIEKYLWQNVTYYLLDIQGYFNDRNLFDGKNADIEPGIFAKAVLESLKGHLDFSPSVIHCNDNQTALIPFLLKTQYRELSINLKTVYTIHFYGYQGIYSRKRIFESIQFSENKCEECLWCSPETNENCVLNKIRPYRKEELEELGIPDDKMSLMKTGINYADYVTTVSEGYASEISQYPDFENISHVYGIRNGVILPPHPKLNYNGDSYIDVSHCKATPAKGDLSGTVQEGKSINKKLFQKECDLEERPDTPLLCMVSRLNAVKGIDQIKNIFDHLMKLDLQLVIIGDDDRNVMLRTGEKQIPFSPYADLFTRKMQEYPHKFRYYKFSEELEYKAYRAADILLMPSLAEACGTTQMLAMKNGVIPVLSMLPSFYDTVIDYAKTSKPESDTADTELYVEKPDGMNRGVGFFAYKDDCWILLSVIKKVCSVYRREKDMWRRIVNSTYCVDFSWENGSLFKYLCLYNNRPEWIHDR